jgi:membrane protease YdiL (CAAX protease family)
MNEPRKPFFSLGELIGYFLLILIGLNILVSIPVIIEIIPEILKNPGTPFSLPIDKLLTANIIWQLLSLITLVLLFRMKNIRVKNYLNLDIPLTLKNSLMIFMVFIGLMLIITPASNYFDIPPNPLMADILSRGNFVLIFLTAVILAPLAEESLFRGFLYNELESRYNSRTALHISSLAFTVIHIQYGIAELAMLLFLAYTLGLIRMRLKNIAYPMALHFINNFAALIEFYYFS